MGRRRTGNSKTLNTLRAMEAFAEQQQQQQQQDEQQDEQQAAAGMSEAEAEALACEIDAQLGGPTNDYQWCDLIDHGDGTWSVWCLGQQYYSVGEWEREQRRAGVKPLALREVE